jgi:alkylation response protein AidB-like acyl-CoA dehydrogenase
MAVDVSEDLKLLRRTIRDFVDREVAPVARYYDEAEEVPYPVLAKAAELGLFGIPFPEQYGGSDMGITGYCVLVEEINRHDASLGTILGASVQLAGMSLLLAGSEQQKQQFLLPLVEGHAIGAWCLTEPGAGSDAAHLSTMARQDGDDWVLDGGKMWITNGSFADTYIVFATVDPALGPRGITAFVVPKDTPGLRAGKVEAKMGLRASHTSSVFFEGCRVPSGNLLGQPGGGYSIAMQTLDIGRCGLGAASLGSARQAFELARGYAVERQQFGRPIADFQAIQFKLADMAVKLYTMEQIVYHCAGLVDRKQSATLESSIVKLYCTEAASQIIDEAIQIHGGMGFSRELPLERMYRDARVTRIFEGTNEIQRYVIASEVLREAGHKIRLY